MEPDRLFVETLDELARATRGPGVTEYELVVASGRLRLLLLDDHRLVDQVNRDASRRLKIRYRIFVHGGGPPAPLREGLLFWAVPDGISPLIAARQPVQIPVAEVPLADFLAEIVMLFRGEAITVRDLISHVANSAGGVHSGPGRGPHSGLLRDLETTVGIAGMDAATRCLRGVIMVTVEALRPLRERVLEQLGAG